MDSGNQKHMGLESSLEQKQRPVKRAYRLANQGLGAFRVLAFVGAPILVLSYWQGWDVTQLFVVAGVGIGFCDWAKVLLDAYERGFGDDESGEVVEW